MIVARPSHTAYRVAIRRAAHQLLDRPPVLDDPIAVPILGAETSAAMRANPSHFERSPLDPFMRAFMAVRSRFAEDRLDAARSAGVRQYVILGAGLDTFAYRQRRLDPPLRIWEVDHPATQAWKRDLLGAARIEIPPNLTYVPVDFERDSLPAMLSRSDFDLSAGAVFTWLGVTMYLTRAAFEATVAFISEAKGAAGGVTFDYGLPRGLLTATQREIFDRLASRVEATGEPWLTLFDPAALAADLRSMGFSALDDVGADELNAVYFTGRTDGLRAGGMARIMWAG